MNAHVGDRLRTGIQLTEGRDAVPEFFDTFIEYVEFCVDYRAKLAQVVKLTAVWLPQQVFISLFLSAKKISTSWCCIFRLLNVVVMASACHLHDALHT